MVRSMTKILRGLVVDESRVRENLNQTHGLVYSQRVLTYLLDELKLSREDSYAIVQENAMKTAAGGGAFLDLLLADERLKDVDHEKLKSLFENEFYLRYVDEIFGRFN